MRRFRVFFRVDQRRKRAFSTSWANALVRNHAPPLHSAASVSFRCRRGSARGSARRLFRRKVFVLWQGGYAFFAKGMRAVWHATEVCKASGAGQRAKGAAHGHGKGVPVATCADARSAGDMDGMCAGAGAFTISGGAVLKAKCAGWRQPASIRPATESVPPHPPKARWTGRSAPGCGPCCVRSELPLAGTAVSG